MRTKEHLNGLLQGTSAFAYSAASERKDVRKTLGLDCSRPILLAVTSSDDEIFAAKIVNALPQNPGGSIYDSQIEWIRDLSQIARENGNWQIVLRIHPRLFPNKREAQRAELADEITDALKEAPSNLIINWPTDELALYDFFPFINVGLNYRSSAGIEMMLFGIPVVAPQLSDFLAYPADLNILFHDRTEYVKAISIALNRGNSIDYAIQSFRWYSFLFTRSVQYLINQSPPSLAALRPKKDGIRLKIWRFTLSAIIRYGPLIRERLQLRTSIKIDNNEIAQVVTRGLESILDIESQLEELTLFEEELQVREFQQELWNKLN